MKRLRAVVLEASGGTAVDALTTWARSKNIDYMIINAVYSNAKKDAVYTVRLTNVLEKQVAVAMLSLSELRIVDLVK